MFLGQFYHNLDEKGRLIVPAKYRDYLLPGGAYVMQGFDQNLMVLPSEKFEELLRRVNQMSMTESITRILRRMVFSTASRVEIDKAGRILLPGFLREHANLENGTVVVGMGDYFEIWSPEGWEKQNSVLQDAQSNPDNFAALHLALA